jgi:biotin carboxyl carrier protein
MRTYVVKIGSRSYDVTLDENEIAVNGVRIDVRVLNRNGCVVTFESSTRNQVVLDEQDGEAFLLLKGREVSCSVESYRDRLVRESMHQAGATLHHSEIKATMPGMVVKIYATPGTPVRKGDPLLILEAMKMENEIRAPVDGVIREIHAVERGSVEKGDLLIVIE